MHLFNLIILLFIVAAVNAQDFIPYDVDVVENGQLITYPFTGGFDSPQFSEGDFNQDGLMDLFVYDRRGKNATIFIRTNEGDATFDYTKDFHQFLPDSLEEFALVRDFNRDNIPDLFVNAWAYGGASGITLFSGYLDLQGNIQYRPRHMAPPSKNSLQIWEIENRGQVHNARTDVPIIDDIDNDGDLDILSFNSQGSYVVYYRNYQEEEGLKKDTMVMRLEDLCFGKFKESGVSQTIILSDNDEVCATGLLPEERDEDNKNNAHAGSTVFAFDHDNDGDKDMLIGDLIYNGLVYIENGGTSEKAFMTNAIEGFPSYSVPFDMPVFNAAFGIDVDQDGLQDLLLSTNESGIAQNQENIWYYKNNGSNDFPYDYQTNNFLVGQTLDFGSYAAPAFVDYNQDGLMDIIVGTSGEFDGAELVPHLMLFKNIGQADNPLFKLEDDDYLNFSQYGNTTGQPAPCFGDMDGDGDLDMIVGDQFGALFYFENEVGVQGAFSFKQPVYPYMNISTGSEIRPFIYDFNKDGLNDLIIGEANNNGVTIPETGEFVLGNINYYENQGTIDQAFFNPNVLDPPNFPCFGQIQVNYSVSTSVKGNAAPVFFEIDERLMILVGSRIGRLSLYEIMSTDPEQPAVLIDDFLAGIDDGDSASPSIADINNDGVYELIIGNIKGGLTLYHTDLPTSTSVEVHNNKSYDVKIFPNPTSGRVYFSFKNTPDTYHIDFYNLDGKLIHRSFNQNEIVLEAVENALLIVKVYDKERLLLIDKISVLK